MCMCVCVCVSSSFHVISSGLECVCVLLAFICVIFETFEWKQLLLLLSKTQQKNKKTLFFVVFA